MKVYGDIESVNLHTGKMMRRLTGDGESTLVPCVDVSHIRLGPRPETIEEYDQRVHEIANLLISAAIKFRKEDELNNRENSIRDCSEIELENRKRNPEWFIEFEHRGLETINENIRKEAIAEIKRREQERMDAEAKRIAAIPPVDRSARVLIDGSPVTEDHREILPSGQQKDYVVLSAQERAKGFVRPVRHTYIHKVCGSTTSMGNALAETYARDPEFYSGTFCCKCGTHFPLDQFNWDDGQPVGS